MNLYQLLHELKVWKPYLTRQQYRTLKGQAVHGDVAGAETGLQRLLQRRNDGNSKKAVG